MEKNNKTKNKEKIEKKTKEKSNLKEKISTIKEGTVDENKQKIKDETIKAYALKNAIEHEGKAAIGSVISGLFAEGLKKEEIKDIMMRVNFIVTEVNKSSLELQKEEFTSLEKNISHRDVRDLNEMPELENIPKTGVIMRFSPSSSASAFHIGHILTGMPSSLYVKKYGGKFYLRIEDTNPEKTVPECYESFPKEAEWIFGNVTEWYAQSDRMDRYYNFAKQLIDKGLAFVCTCKKIEKDEESEEKEEIKPREICKCRNNPIKDNNELWSKMLDKKGFKEGEAVLRFKSKEINLNNSALIDFPLARINLTKHPRQGNKYRVWPLMNLCVTFDDIEQGCTHIIRAKEHQDNAKRQEMIMDALKVKKPQTYFLGRYKFEDMPISKTQITELIKKGKFSGWDDIRLPLARNFKRRGYQPEAFAKMACQRGLSPVDKVIAKEDLFQVLDNFNREIIKEKAIQAEFTETKNGDIEILMADATIKKVKANIDLRELKDGAIVYFKTLGYARYNPGEKIKFWFCHK
jgi:glutamyl-tRNA synthetase